MAYINEGDTTMTGGIDAGTAALLTNKGDGFGMGGGLIGGLLLGGLLTGRGGGLFGGGYGAGYGTPAASAVASEIVLTPTLNAIQGQIGNLSNQVNTDALTDQIVDGFSGIDAGITSINQNISGTTRDLLNSIANVSTAQAAGNFTTLSSINGLGRDITAQANQNALQQLNSFNNLTTSTLQGFNEVGRDNANAFNQVQMSLNAMSAQNAACCCELKSTIRDDGDATRALINDLNVQNLQAQLSDAKTQNATLSQTITQKALLDAQTNVILQHIPFLTTPSIVS